jgi:arylsulfatase A-like enzyme
MDITDNTPLREGKKSLYEGGLRVPCVWRVPGLTPAGETTQIPSSTVDFFPTLCALADITIPDELRQKLDGGDLSQTLANPSEGDYNRPILFHNPYGHSWSALVRGDWKIIQYLTRDKMELYNLAADIGETHDVSDAEPAKLQELQN